MLFWILWLVCSAAMASADALPALPGDPWSAISGASPPVALALALAYGAYQLGGVATRLTGAVTALLERGVPVRVELAEADRALLARVVEAVEERDSGTRRASRALRDASQVVR